LRYPGFPVFLSAKLPVYLERAGFGPPAVFGLPAVFGCCYLTKAVSNSGGTSTESCPGKLHRSASCIGRQAAPVGKLHRSASCTGRQAAPVGKLHRSASCTGKLHRQAGLVQPAYVNFGLLIQHGC
jgi:hypothetical protein